MHRVFRRHREAALGFEQQRLCSNPSPFPGWPRRQFHRHGLGGVRLRSHRDHGLRKSNGQVWSERHVAFGSMPQDFERALPLFNALGKTITHMGPLGAGGLTKLANQIIVAINLTAIGEALVFGAKAGVDPEKMIRALSGGLAGSKCLDQKSGKILNGDFAPGFKIDLHFKDLNLIHDAARSVGAPVPTAAFVEQLFATLRVRGRGGLDHSGVITLFEDLADVRVRKEN